MRSSKIYDLMLDSKNLRRTSTVGICTTLDLIEPVKQFSPKYASSLYSQKQPSRHVVLQMRVELDSDITWAVSITHAGLWPWELWHNGKSPFYNCAYFACSNFGVCDLCYYPIWHSHSSYTFSPNVSINISNRIIAKFVAIPLVQNYSFHVIIVHYGNWTICENEHRNQISATQSHTCFKQKDDVFFYITEKIRALHSTIHDDVSFMWERYTKRRSRVICNNN